jgi:hypothetical protein
VNDFCFILSVLPIAMKSHLVHSIPVIFSTKATPFSLFICNTTKYNS